MGIPIQVTWVGPYDVLGDPVVPWPLLYADAVGQDVLVTAPDGFVKTSLESAFATWAFLDTVIDGMVCDSPPAFPGDWPARPPRGFVA